MILTVMVVTSAATRRPDAQPAAYATGSAESADSVHYEAAVKRHYSIGLRFYGTLSAAFSLAVVGASGLNPGYLFPLGIAGLCGFGITQRIGLASIYWTWKCSRVLRDYPMTFRAPVHKLNLRQDGKRVLRLGPDGTGGSPVMSARDPLLHDRWPAQIADGVWFAGDDLFGGVLLVPGSGELLFAQPREWAELADERARADEGRRGQSKRAGLFRRAV